MKLTIIMVAENLKDFYLITEEKGTLLISSYFDEDDVCFDFPDGKRIVEYCGVGNEFSFMYVVNKWIESQEDDTLIKWKDE